MRPPEPSSEPAPPTEVPPAVADALDSLARHRAVLRRYGDVVRPPGEARERLEIARAERREAEEAVVQAARGADDQLLREEARSALDAEAAARSALRYAVERYARDLRRQGVPPERMIVAVKGVVRRAATSPDPLPEPECLIPDLVQWSVSAYFAAD